MRVRLPRRVSWKKDRRSEPRTGGGGSHCSLVDGAQRWRSKYKRRDLSALWANRRKCNRMLALAGQSGLGLLPPPPGVSGAIRSQINGLKQTRRQGPPWDRGSRASPTARISHTQVLPGSRSAGVPEGPVAHGNDTHVFAVAGFGHEALGSVVQTL